MLCMLRWGREPLEPCRSRWWLGGERDAGRRSPHARRTMPCLCISNRNPTECLPMLFPSLFAIHHQDLQFCLQPVSLCQHSGDRGPLLSIVPVSLCPDLLT